MGGRASREKGKRGERKTATDLRGALPQFGDKIKRGWQCRGGADAADVEGIPGFWFEVKNCKKIQARPALEQALEANGRKTIAVAVIREDGKEAYAALLWTDFLQLIQRYFTEEDKNARRDRELLHLGSARTDGGSAVGRGPASAPNRRSGATIRTDSNVRRKSHGAVLRHPG